MAMLAIGCRTSVPTPCGRRSCAAHNHNNRAVSVSWCRTWFLCPHGVMRTRSNRAPECGLCGARMKKNGHDRLGRQRWMCPGCRTTGAVRDLSRRRRAELAEFLGWLLAPSPQPSGSRAFRKRTSWCWGLRPVLEPDAAARHAVMADGTYLKGGGCLRIAIDGLSGEVIAWQWCARESMDEYITLSPGSPHRTCWYATASGASRKPVGGHGPARAYNAASCMCNGIHAAT